jgi:transaldolase
MKILLATARTEDVAWGAAHGMLDGVLTTPGLLAAESGSDARAHLLELCRLVQGPIFAAVQTIDAAGACRDGKELAKISDQIVVQVPLVEATLGAMRRLHADGIRVAATYVFNTAQALLAARTGVSSVVIALDELDAAGHDGIRVVREVRAAFDSSDAECDVIAVSAASPTQFGACATAGADAAAVTEQVCRSLLVHPLTDRGVHQFLGDVSRLRRLWPVS